MIGGAVVSILADKLTGKVGEYFGAMSEASKLSALARADAVKNGIPGWKDEYLVFVWSFPTVSAFIPFLRDGAQSGFIAMQSFPDWYTGGFITVTGAVFGIDKWVKFKQGTLWNR